jgi:alanine racemase
MKPLTVSPKQSQHTPKLPHRDAWLEVNLGAIEHNARQLRASLPAHLQLMAVVKADAYGHGAEMVAPILQACGFALLGVASIDEAIALRQAGIELPILVLSSSPEWAMPLAHQHNVQLTVFNQRQYEGLQRLNKPITVQIKVDTGMHRVGVSPQEALAFITQCQALPHVTVAGVYSHLACADNPAENTRQWQAFAPLVEALPPMPWVHLANSMGGFGLPPEALAQTNLARLGIALYGYEVTPTQLSPTTLPLRPAMGLKARIVNLQTLPPNEGVSYNHTYRTQQQPTLIATLPVGYADGIMRGLSNQLTGWVQGHWVPQVGNITMDQLMMDVTACPSVQLGDIITLLGESLVVGNETQALTLTPWATTLNTIDYELMCALRVRLPRLYTRT